MKAPQHMQPPLQNKSRLSVWLLVLCLGGIGLVVASGVWYLYNRGTGASITQSGTNAQTVIPATPISTIVGGEHRSPQPAVSPLLFGTNLILNNSSDQVLTSTTTQRQLQQLHVQIIRMPIRDFAPETVNVQAAEMIKQLGATPLVILHGAADADALAVGRRVIPDMNRIFGKNVVYYEFGNENDLEGVSSYLYATRWNSIIPQFKALALNGKFIGPVKSDYNHAYISTFLSMANPHPDAISWHEYTCNAFAANSVCIANLSRWTTHVQDARATMKATIGTNVPIMITEWNYAPDASAADNKHSDSTFMQTWTMKAMKTLADNHVFASMQYACTHPIMSLITSTGTLTAQGGTFQDAYKQLMKTN
jgi:hypothetical protein